MTCVYNEIIAANRADYNKIKSVVQSTTCDMDFKRLSNYPNYLKFIPDCTIKCHMQALMHEMVHRKISSVETLKKKIQQYCNKYYPNITPIFVKSDKATLLVEPRQKTEPATFTNKDLEDLIKVSKETPDPSFDQLMEKYHKQTPYDEYAHLATKAFLMTGAFDWKDWALTNWGTIWNANNAHADNDRMSIVWESANVPSEKIVKMICNKARVPMYYRWSDFHNTCKGAEMILSAEYVDNGFIGPNRVASEDIDVANLEYNITRDKSLVKFELWKDHKPLSTTMAKVMKPITDMEDQFKAKWMKKDELHD